MRRKKHNIGKKIGLGAGIVGGVLAAGYAATRLWRRSREESPAELNARDADRALDYEPGSNFDYGRGSSAGDPSARTSVGLESPGL